MKPKKVTESDDKSYLNRTIDLKKKLNCLKEILDRKMKKTKK